MSFMRLAASTAILITVSAGCAWAAPALVTTNVNMRQGPGTTYQIVTTIPGGSTVDVAGCTGEWCQVAWQGQSGYAIATALDSGNGTAAQGGPVPGYDVPVPAYGPAPPPVIVAPPPYYYGYGPYYGYGWGYRGYYRGYGYGYRGGYGRRW
jgi:uncharacterized protein YraI